MSGTKANVNPQQHRKKKKKLHEVKYNNLATHGLLLVCCASRRLHAYDHVSSPFWLVNGWKFLYRDWSKCDPWSTHMFEMTQWVWLIEQQVKWVFNTFKSLRVYCHGYIYWPSCVICPKWCKQPVSIHQKNLFFV